MKKKIFLAIFLIVSMAVPAFSFIWKDYDYSEENIKKFEDLVTKEFYFIRDEIFAPKYPEIKDVEIVWDMSEEDWKNRNSGGFYMGRPERKIRISPYVKIYAGGIETEMTTLLIVHELSHDVSPKGGHGEEFVEIFYKMADEYLSRVFDGTLKSEMFTDLDYYNTEKGIESISKDVEKISSMEKKDLTILNLKKKLKLKILQ